MTLVSALSISQQVYYEQVYEIEQMCGYIATGPADRPTSLAQRGAMGTALGGPEQMAPMTWAWK